MSLANDLFNNGCHIPIEEFKDTLVDILHNEYRNYTVDELLLHPHDAIDYCDKVKHHTGCQGLPEQLILRCLMSRRKNP